MTLRLTTKNIHLSHTLQKLKTQIFEYVKTLFEEAYGSIILDAESTPIEVNKKINIILSPSFYWVRREKLPVKSSSQAKKVAPTFFEGIVPEGEYSYRAIKEKDGTYLLFAYDERMIADKLKEMQIKDYFVKNIYFAQTEIKELPSPLRITKNHALIIKDGIISRIDTRFISESSDRLDIQKHSRHHISISRYSTALLDTKMIERLSVAILVMIVALSVSYYLKNKEYGKLLDKREAILAKYKLPQTSIQRDTIKKSLEKTTKEQSAFREKISYIFDLPLQQDEHFVSIKAAKDVSIAIKMADEKRAEAIKSYLEKKISLKSAKVKDNIITIEGAM